MPTAANWICGSTDRNFDRSAVPVGTVSEDVYIRKVLYLSYTLSGESLLGRGQSVEIQLVSTAGLLPGSVLLCCAFRCNLQRASPIKVKLNQLLGK